MEWLMMNAYGVHSYSENLGYFLDGSYIIADECQETLLDILEQMQSEDPVTWQLRRQMALAEILTKDFVPLLLNLDPEEHAEIFQLMMIVLADLSQPQMCLMTHSRSTHGFLPNKQPMKIQELSKLHNDAQQMFLNEDLVKEVFNNIRSIISQKEPLTDQQIAAIVHFFLLIRNLLHTPDGDRDSQTDSMSSQQYRLFRNFLRFGLGDILISSLAIQQWEAFSEVAVHLLSVMFKEQVDLLHDRTTQELVSLRSEREGLECMSDSLSADRNDGLKNENGGEFPGVSTDNNKVPETNMSGEMVVSLPESGRNSVDFQPGTDVPILGGDSGDSANTCGPENKYFDEQKQRRSLTELVSVIRCMEETLSVTDTSGDSMLQPGQDVNQVSTALDSSFKEIRIQLQEFAVEFVQTSFSKLVLSFLNRQLQCKPDADSTLYIWMTAYFLTFSRTNDIEYDFISEVFLREVLAAITYQGLRLCSQISQSDTGQQDHLQDLYKKLHLVVCIFKEVFRILHNYASDIHSTEMEKALSSIQDDLALMKGLRQLFVIIIRTCKIAQQGHIFLSEAMETNHCLLVCLDSAIHQRKTTLRLVDHIQQFASRPVMENYGHMLTYFKTNNPDLNSAIFTMMHHVAGDCGKAETLLQPTVLNSLTAVSDDGYPITQDINDLLEYVFGIFIHCVQSSPESVAQLFFPSDDEEEEEEGFSEEEKDLAISLCMDCQENDDVAKVIRSKLELNGVSKSEEQVFKFLETMGYVSSDKDTDCATDADSGFQSDSADGTSTYEIQTKNCVDKLRAMHMGRSIEWLQTSLVEAWNAKLALAGVRPSKQGITWEPWPFFSLAQDKHVPLLVTNDDHQAAVDLPLFSCLAGALDLRLEGNNSFSIPKTWSAETLLNKARLLGDLNYDDMLFTIEEFEAHLSQKQSEFTHPSVDHNEDNNEKPMSLPKVFWPAAVQKLNRVWSPGNGFTGTNCTSE